MGKKVVIVGGVAGGASAAARLRRLDEQAEIILLERDEHISFANCGLPYYIGETIRERDKLLVQTPEAMRARFAIDVRVNSEVTAIEPEKKMIRINSRDRGCYEESYDVLLLSPGAQPVRPPIPGIDSPRIFTLRNIPDTDRIKAMVDRENTQRVAVIGGGFIGVEMAENLRERGLAVTLVEAAPHILPPFDSDMALLIERELQDHGVTVHVGDGVAHFAEQAEGMLVTLQSGRQIVADMVVLAIGVAPATGFLKDSGIALGKRGHILVDEHMATNQTDIYAVGDAVEVVDLVTGQPAAVPLAGPANKQGRIAADNIAGIPSAYKGTQGTAILKVFDLTAAATGNNERSLARLQVPYQAIYVHPNSHASYYPDALQLTIKLLFGNDGKILGAQAVGPESIDKHIDVLATAIRLNGTVQDLTELELSYAPPYSSAKDPVNMAGFVAENILAKRLEVFTYEELAGFDPQTTVLVDVRSPLEFATNALPGAVNLPTDSLRSRLAELDKNKLILTYCKVGLQSYIAARILSQNGFRVKSLTGGYKAAAPRLVKWQPPAEQVQPAVEPAMAAVPLSEPEQVLDACGLSCPGPLLQVKAAMDKLAAGGVLRVTASDPGFLEDIKAWCLRTGHTLLSLQKEKNRIVARLQKQAVVPGAAPACTAPAKDNKTIVVFSGDLDKAMAAFIIANGAAAMGKKVTLFFTFWGLNILRKPETVPVAKGFLDRMFGWMMPRGSEKLTLSNMNMLGLGTAMMRRVMNNKQVASLEELMKSAMTAGVEIVACQMSMDVMGFKPEELLDGVKIGGVGYYLSEAEDANVNLFI
ncbi:DsrE/DsrF/DrsH-like family protein [Propionispora vibrioides]|uniref:NADPH-dependent 2,4-dienoyl-CoA reductase, sulfur reductase n=1 Tax=Propionispora vibrioides TaxID=112903 RepID=A0A1H8UD24_9FIRM|nr:NADPH-dependent 2,4-dienoyl-CoA reductase, sulfur reductase [Propionispora vibrioides]